MIKEVCRELSAKNIGEFINIGTGKDLTIKELAEMIKNIVGFNGEIEWDSSKPDGLPCLPCSEAYQGEMRSIFLWSKVYRGLILFLRGTPRKLLDVSRLNKLDWKAKTRLEEGIKREYEWYLQSR